MSTDSLFLFLLYESKDLMEDSVDKAKARKGSEAQSGSIRGAPSAMSASVVSDAESIPNVVFPKNEDIEAFSTKSKRVANIGYKLYTDAAAIQRMYHAVDKMAEVYQTSLEQRKNRRSRELSEMEKALESIGIAFKLPVKKEEESK